MLLRIVGPMLMGHDSVEDPVVINADLPCGWVLCSGLRRDLVEGNAGSRVIMDLVLTTSPSIWSLPLKYTISGTVLNSNSLDKPSVGDSWSNLPLP